MLSSFSGTAALVYCHSAPSGQMYSQCWLLRTPLSASSLPRLRRHRRRKRRLRGLVLHHVTTSAHTAAVTSDSLAINQVQPVPHLLILQTFPSATGSYSHTSKISCNVQGLGSWSHCPRIHDSYRHHTWNDGGCGLELEVWADGKLMCGGSGWLQVGMTGWAVSSSVKSISKYLDCPAYNSHENGKPIKTIATATAPEGARGKASRGKKKTIN